MKHPSYSMCWLHLVVYILSQNGRLIPIIAYKKTKYSALGRSPSRVKGSSSGPLKILSLPMMIMFLEGRNPKSTREKTDKSNGGDNASYYANRHAEARREYQNRYNQLQRLTRRKLSKSDLQALRKRKSDELDGVIPAFENQICRRSAGLDPERTDNMEAAEGKLADELNSLKWGIAEQQSQLRHIYAEDEWIETYIRELCIMRDIAVGGARTWIEVNCDLKGTRKWKEEVHRRRRTVAIYHQEIDLYRQGPEIPLLALRLNELISAGFCVNKTVFRRLYRF
ncbi:hypothetical protein QCA50_006397 [Cerrena zonata]|uniref:Uncharacterized protein n=1 Tax=Cerrena zonata TaxID=2478898 RepID=A0AAW0G8J8_9APHY